MYDEIIVKRFVSLVRSFRYHLPFVTIFLSFPFEKWTSSTATSDMRLGDQRAEHWRSTAQGIALAARGLTMKYSDEGDP